MKHIYIIIGIALLLFASCGRQQQAKSVVKDFMAEQLHQTDIDYYDFSEIDSTRALSDSIIQVLRQRGPKDVQYQHYKGKTLLLIRAKYLRGNDSCSTTFYLDSEATGVIAFKEN